MTATVPDCQTAAIGCTKAYLIAQREERQTGGESVIFGQVLYASVSSRRLLRFNNWFTSACNNVH